MRKKNNEDIVMQLAYDQNYIVSVKQVEALGINSKTISRLVEKGKLRKITKGVYVIKELFKDKYYEKQARARQGIFSHETALYLHGLISEEPERVKITIPTHYNTRIITDGENEFHYLKKDYCSYGIEYMQSSENNQIKVYNLDRTICDLLNHKNRLEQTRLNELMSIYIKSDKKDLQNLKEYSNLLGVEDELKKHILIY